MKRDYRRLVAATDRLEMLQARARADALQARLARLSDGEVDALARVAEQVKAGVDLITAVDALPDGDRVRVIALGVHT